jgi:hypothetical protein
LLKSNNGQPWHVVAYVVAVGIISAISAAAMNQKVSYRASTQAT